METCKCNVNVKRENFKIKNLNIKPKTKCDIKFSMVTDALSIMNDKLMANF